MTRIAIFTDTDLDRRTDLATALKAVLRHTNSDLRARIFTTSDFGTATDEYFAAASFGCRLPWDRGQRVFWPRLRPFARELKAAGTQVVHIATPGPVGLVGRLLANRYRLPIVGSRHAPLAVSAGANATPSRSERIAERCARWAYGGAPLLVPSQASRDHLALRGFERLQVWTAGIDATRFAPVKASSALRESWHVNHQRPAILVPLRLLAEGEVRMVEPIRRGLFRHATAHQFVFVGRALAAVDLREICPDGVFIEDAFDERLAVAMASCDVCLSLSAMDAVGAAALKAQACGLPVIAMAGGGASEQFVPGVTGEVVRAGDVEDIVSSLTALLRNAQRRAAMGRDARTHALRRDWPTMLGPLHTAWRTAAVTPSRAALPFFTRSSP